MACAGIVAYAYPGFMSVDSMGQLREARQHRYSDWHPPAMAVLWCITDMFIAGPLGMLLLQLGLFVGGAFYWMKRLFSPVHAAIATLALCWFPPVGLTIAVVWKDCQMLGFLMAGTALLVADRRSLRVVGLLFMLCASMMRHNAFTTTMALIICLFVWSSRDGWKRYALSTVVWLVVTVAGLAANRALTDEPGYWWHRCGALFDIAGTIRYAPPLSDAELAKILDGVPRQPYDDIQRAFHKGYTPGGATYTLVGSVFEDPTNAEERAAVTRTWKTLVTTYPRAYLRHRFQLAVEVLGLKAAHQGVWVGFVTPARDLVEDRAGPTRLWMRHVALNLGLTWMFRPIVYLLLLLAGVPAALRARDRFSLSLIASALFSEMALFILAPAPDFRFSVWLVPCAAYVGVLAVRDLVVRVKALRQLSGAEAA